MNFIGGILFASLSTLSPQLGPTDSDAFNLYYIEFTENYLEPKHGMKNIIEKSLAEAVFSSNDETQFKNFIRLLKNASESAPERNKDFRRLDRLLATEFETRMENAKSIRWIYSAAGAIAGAVVAFPIGKMVAGGRYLLLALPAGALAGAGAGFLLSDLINMPHYRYSEGDLTDDVNSKLNELDDIELGGGNHE
ncbi:MAG: hypothetical protein COV44_09265 [Deltaproteobacteria bacterium CG11_big_fil_rev_8_21_14_0_20_45_16]|nr:MAG: hypothetical protein COV44_09265 [Deltaproteobacteria bacterium CG11_big_fil_rev_8_21_14_0_20_45_16]